MRHRFTKMHGIGNDFVIFDAFADTINLNHENIRHIADRHFGIGCDQVLLLEPPRNEKSDARYRIFNADGAEVMQCGNGARCVAVYLREKGLVAKDNIIVETGGGTLALKINADDGVTVNMGRPEFVPRRIPLNVEERSDVYRLAFGEDNLEFGALSMGNPHAVIKVDNVDTIDVNGIGTAVQNDSIFPEGANVGFMQILNKRAFRLRVFERGAGETLACGSGACAAMVSACQRGYLQGTIDAELKGGHLTLDWAGDGSPVYMTGPATIVFEGKIEL